MTSPTPVPGKPPAVTAPCGADSTWTFTPSAAITSRLSLDPLLMSAGGPGSLYVSAGSSTRTSRRGQHDRERAIHGAQRQVAEEAEQERTDHIDALKERALALLDKGAVKKLEEKARKALDAYVAAALAHRTELTEIVRELSELGELPDDLELDMQPNGYR